MCIGYDFDLTAETVFNHLYNRTPSYAAPEVFIDPKSASFPADIWSLAASLFHLVCGELPFESSTPILASVNISDMSKPAPNIKEKAPADRQISVDFAAVIAKGLEKKIENRFKSIDEMSTALHRCLVMQGTGTYSVFISSSHLIRDKIFAHLLYKLLNSTRTPKMQRVFVCMCPLKDGATGSCDDFSLYIKNAIIVIPILSKLGIESLNGLKGSDDDNVNQYLKELILMQILLNHPTCVMKKIFPINIDDEESASSAKMDLVTRESCPTINAVEKFLVEHFFGKCELEEITNRTKYSVKASVSNILSLTKHNIQNPRVGQKQEKNQSQGLHSEDDEGIEDYIVDELKDVFDSMCAGDLTDWKNTIRNWASILQSTISEIRIELDLVNAENQAAPISEAHHQLLSNSQLTTAPTRYVDMSSRRKVSINKALHFGSSLDQCDITQPGETIIYLSI